MNHNISAIVLIYPLYYILLHSAVFFCLIVCCLRVAGDAQVAMIRNKVKHIYDFTADVGWKLESSFGNMTGTIHIEDITADREYELTVTVR
jgi:hypothetical protein